MRRLKTAVFTTSRADYGLLYPLIKKINEDSYFELMLVVAGNHFLPEYGYTVSEIRKDGFTHFDEIKTFNGGDNERDILFSIADSIKDVSMLLDKLRPEVVIILGDRYELWSISIPSVIHRIPIVHIHGGETTSGSTDEVVRHSITKAASIHFASIEEYRKRIISMGEDPSRVFAVGALAIDNMKQSNLLSIDELSLLTGVDFGENIGLLTYHPVTFDDYFSSTKKIKEVLDAVVESDILALITMPNADVGGMVVFKEISAYLDKYPQRLRLIKNLGHTAYLSAMKYAKIMIGNSSSGIIESASFKLPVVNIGDRQDGRMKPANIIDCKCKCADIILGIEKALSKIFNDGLRELENPYGDGKAAGRIIQILKSIDFYDKEKLLKKRFYEIR